MIKRVTLFCIALLTIGSLKSQGGVKFIENISLENALSLANQTNQNVFIDTYASWCIPCKKMEIEFLNKEVSSFFNLNYINVRIDMDNSLYADEYRKKFDVVFLPTMIILDGFGNVKYKTDKIIPGRELVGIARKAINPNVFFESDASSIQSNRIVSTPKSTNSVQPNNPNLPETIVHTTGQGVKPEFLRQEAYFRIELMDGSHRKVAEQYLETQEDWSSPENLRFIFDFLHSTQSKEFRYFATNLDKFRSAIGEREVALSLEYLINDRLNFGFPRPRLEECKALFKLIDPDNYEQRSHLYFLDRLINECKYDEYNELATKYLKTLAPKPNNNIHFTMAEQCLVTGKIEQDQMNSCINSVKKAIEIDENIPTYHETLARLYLKNDQKRKARKAAKKALKLAEEQNLEMHSIQNLLDQL